MTTRSAAGWLLLFLVSLSIVESTAGVAANLAVQRHQSRVSHQIALRGSQRSSPVIAADAPASPVLPVHALPVVIEASISLPLVSQAVFVPPRV